MQASSGMVSRRRRNLTVKPKELSEMLARNAEEVAKLLLPNGRRDGREWRCGSVNGEAGASLGVHLYGDKSGVWSDFATGDSGDLLDLWQSCRGVGLVEAMKEAASWLGVSLDPPKFSEPKKRTFKRPSTSPSASSPESAVFHYLTVARGLSPESIKAFRVGEQGKNILFPFYRNGDLIMVKWRSIEAKRCGVTEKDMEPALFGWQAIPKEARWVAITEGEIDAMSLHEYGIPALSVPFGGGSGAKQDWIETEFDNLERFDEIFLCLDMDDEGRRAVTEIVDRLGRHRCRVVELPRKDANECLTSGITHDVMYTLFSNAKTLDPSELKNAISYRDGVIAAFNPGERELGFKPPWDKCKTLLFRPGEVSLIAGVNGHGKSEGVGHMTLDAISQGQRACVASMEFKPERWLMRLVRQASGNANPSNGYIDAIMRWLERSLWVFDVSTTAKHERMLDVFKYARQRYGVTLFVIDNLSKLDIDLDDYNGQRAFVDKLTDFAKEHDVHVFLVAHVRKGDDDGKPGGKFDVKGSGAITDLVDTVLIWWRNRKKEDRLKRQDLGETERLELEEAPDAVCLCEKQRNGEDEPRIALWFDKASHQFLPSKDWHPREYVRYSEIL
jgi:twinkle protein